MSYGTNLKQKTLVFSFALLSFFVFSSHCLAAGTDCSGIGDSNQKSLCMIKNNTTVVASTTSQNDFYSYDAADTTLSNDMVYCEGVTTTVNYGPLNPLYCNATSGAEHFEHKEFYSSDDGGSDTAISGLDKDFTIDVSSQSNLGINNIVIEWKNSDRVTPLATGFWTDVSSQQCFSGSCSVCREGGSCDYPVIPAEMLSTLSDGTQNVLWFRVIITDNSANSITMGEDEDVSMTPVLDKCYRFPICNQGGCAPSCVDGSGDPLNTAPVVQSLGASTCEADGSFDLEWTFSDDNSQFAFYLEIYDKDTGEGVYTSGYVESGSTSWPSSNFIGSLIPGRDYYAKVRILDNYATVNCRQWSAWFDGDVFSLCDSCAGNTEAPVVGDTDVTPPSDFCNLVGLPYVFSWNFTDGDGDGQSGYKIKFVNTSDSSETVLEFPDSTSQSFISYTTFIALDYETQYDWYVMIKDDYPDDSCQRWSAWKFGGTFTTPRRHPFVRFDARNDEGDDCTASGGCEFLENINLIDQSTVTDTSSATYTWTIEGVFYDNNKDTSRTFAGVDCGSDDECNVELTVLDNGCECSWDDTLFFDMGLPIWNEVAPGTDS